MKEAPKSSYPNLVFREPFNSESSVLRNGGQITDVSFSNGIGSFNGTSSFIDYNLGLNGTYSVRVRCNPTSFASARILLDCRSSSNSGVGYIFLDGTTGNVGRSTGTAYVNGVATNTTTTGVNNEIVVTGITLKQGTGANLSLIGSNFANLFKFLGTMDLFEIYSGVLTPSEVKNLYGR